VLAKETSTRAWVHTPPVAAPTSRRRAARAAAPPAAAGREPGLVPTRLPPDVAWFTGRRRELRRLRELLAIAGRRPAVVISAIDGIAGVGKSTLVVHAAHALAARFADGQLYVDLRGSSSGLQPLEPLEVLGRFLRALGVDGEDVPIGLEEAVERFRSLLTGRRVLVILDNAASAAQVQPLLPASTGSAALITSRQALFALEGAVHLHLDVLTPREAVALLRRLAGSERVAAEPSAAATIARQCGLLPLALRIAGARLAARPSWPLHALVEQLADERRRLDRLELGDLAIRASFQLSYQALLDAEDGPLAARIFRLLGLLDGPDISIPVAAALSDEPAEVVEALLERLVDAQMLQSPVPGRYRMHDLLRLFAREQADQRETAAARRAALRRALRCYLATAQRASRLLQPARLRPGVAGDSGGVGLRDRGDALVWLEAERGNLVAAAQQAALEPRSVAAVTVELASALFWFLQARGYWRDWEALNQLAVQVTRRLGDRRGESRALSDLAGAYHRLGRVDEAISCLETGLRIHRELGDRAGEQAVLSNLGIVYRESGRLEEAIASCRLSLEISHETADRYGEAILVNSLGKIYREQGRFDAAITAYAESLGAFEELGDAYGQGNALANLGEVCGVAGRAGEAVDYCQRSLELFREVGDRSDEAEALWRLGSAWDALGRRELAHACWREALAIFTAIGAPRASEIERLLGGDSRPAP
jgi:tetratricopeptide (TPR) repeat protein